MVKTYSETEMMKKARAALELGDYQEALEHYSKALEEAKVERDKSDIVAAENGIIETILMSGLSSDEDIDINRTLKTVEATKNRSLKARTLVNAAMLMGKDIMHVESDSFSLELMKQAEGAFQEASSLYQELAKTKEKDVAMAGWIGIVETGIAMGRFYLDLDQPEAALEDLREVRSFSKKLDSPFLRARLYQLLGFTRNHLGDLKEALKDYKISRRYWKELGNQDMTLLVEAGIGEVYLSLENYERALDQFEELYSAYKILKIRSGQAEMQSKMAQAYIGLEDIKKARKQFEKAIVLYKKMGDRRKTVFNKVGGLDTLFLLGKKRFAKTVLLDLLHSEPVKQFPESFNYLYEIVQRESWLKKEKKFKEMFEDPDPLTIDDVLMEEFLQSAKEAFPNEFGAMLHGHPHIHDFEIPPDTGRGARSVTFNLYNRFSGKRISADGVVHSHPSGSARPSKADLSLFGRFRGINIIIGYPFKMDSWAAYDMFGNRVNLSVVKKKLK
jgi:tetratricopeptide (TPR) repeat protein